GEMHWSTDVSHAPEFTYSNVHLLPKTSHLWIFSGGSCGSRLILFSIHKDQDQMNIPFLSVERKSISSLSVNNDQVSQKNFSSDFSDKTKYGIPNYSKLNGIQNDEEKDFSFHSNRFKSKRKPHSGISIEIPINGIFRRNSIFTFFDDPRYRRKSSGILKYGTLKVDSIVQKEDMIEYRGVQKFKTKYEMKEVHILPESSAIMVQNYSIIGVDTRITLNIRSQVGGLIQVERKKGLNSKYFRGISIFRTRQIRYPDIFFFLVRPVATYEITDSINLATLFPQDLFRKKDNIQLRVFNYMLYGNGKPTRGISDTSIQLVRTCLFLNWDQDNKISSLEEVHAFVVEYKGFDSRFHKNWLSKIPYFVYKKKE
ncbi:LOW QUALITY PROTEIN: hypothetical protein HID58_048475, partial [Brassica napus]